jgi:hypothetical protein
MFYLAIRILIKIRISSSSLGTFSTLSTLHLAARNRKHMECSGIHDHHNRAADFRM